MGQSDGRRCNVSAINHFQGVYIYVKLKDAQGKGECSPHKERGTYHRNLVVIGQKSRDILVSRKLSR